MLQSWGRSPQLRPRENQLAAAQEWPIVQDLYYRWSKDFLEAGKKRLAGDTARAATSDEVKDLRREAGALKEVVAELTLENRLLKKKHDGRWELASAQDRLAGSLHFAECAIDAGFIGVSLTRVNQQHQPSQPTVMPLGNGGRIFAPQTAGLGLRCAMYQELEDCVFFNGSLIENQEINYPETNHNVVHPARRQHAA